MNERQMQFTVGLVVFATFIVGGLLAAVNSSVRSLIPWGTGAYTINIELTQAPGIGPGTPVRKSGLLIGRVKSIEDLDDRILVHARIDGGRRLFPQYACQIRTSVLGDAVIDFVAAPVPPGTPPLADGATVRGDVVGNPLDMFANMQGDLQVTIRSLGTAGDEVARLARRVDQAFGSETEEGRVKRLFDTTEVAMEQFGRTMRSINEILGDEPTAGTQPTEVRRQMDQTLPPPGIQQPPSGQPGQPLPPSEGQQLRERLRQGLNDLPQAISEMRATMQDFRVVLQSIEKNSKNLEGLTEPLGRNGEQIASSIVEAVDGLDKLVEEFTVLSQSLNNREGTLGRLINDPQLYDNANRTICNANQVILQVNELTKRLRVVVEDARVFMDKVAREPGRVVTGGLSPSPLK
jgi:phospholipid/cholesterol/gamma-HCH transport system substrate-binding protein